MDISSIIDVVMMQRRRYYVNFLMNVFVIMNISNSQHRMYYDNYSMNVFNIVTVLMGQLGTSCTFDSPGLASESEGYPGSFAVSSNNAVGVVPFIPRHFIAAFHAEKVQHLRR